MANERDDEQFGETEGSSSGGQPTGQQGQQSEFGQQQQGQQSGLGSQPTMSGDQGGQHQWAERLARILGAIAETLRKEAVI